jgi:hypothetical protein
MKFQSNNRVSTQLDENQADELRLNKMDVKHVRPMDRLHEACGALSSHWKYCV